MLLLGTGDAKILKASSTSDCSSRMSDEIEESKPLEEEDLESLQEDGSYSCETSLWKMRKEMKIVMMAGKMGMKMNPTNTLTTSILLLPSVSTASRSFEELALCMRGNGLIICSRSSSQLARLLINKQQLIGSPLNQMPIHSVAQQPLPLPPNAIGHIKVEGSG
uniref:Uncharacterized protein n=1 Tax=Ditylenchus dipsaci TaxID=166011 RepID=A0A915DTD6_9BILA